MSLDSAAGQPPQELDGTSATALASAFQAQTGKHWVQFPFEMKFVGNSLNKAVMIQANLEPTNAR